MTSFLEHVAKDIIRKFGTDLSRTALIFPNKRASLFINEYLAKEAGKPMWSPSYITISDLFRKHSTLAVGDQLKLISDLHKCFTRCTGSTETLDHFFGWGQLILSDFDDIDKNMANADKIFANVRDIHELDDLSYLTEEQINAIRMFFSNFSEEHNSELKRRFLTLWNQFANIYHEFNTMLREQGLAYEGALYRNVVESQDIKFEYERYIFVGFNLLQKVEQRLFDILKKNGQAYFYWDFDKYYMPQGKAQAIQHEAGLYISQYMSHYPNELDTADDEIYDNFRLPKQIHFMASGTEDMQARYADQWLRQQERSKAGRRTAIVMCNEQLLSTIVHCLPEEVDKVNITTGYPLSQSPVSSLLKVLLELATVGYSMQTDKYRLKFVNAVLCHPYMRYISAESKTLFRQINIDTKVYYPTPLQLAIDEGTSELFNGLDFQGTTAKDTPKETVKWIMRLLKIIAANSRENVGDPLFRESLFRTYTLLNRIVSLCEAGDLDIDIVTMQRLIFQLVDSTSIPFHGEPAEGVQIMGMLETRNIDFDHVLLLSCNEGSMPKGTNNTSFIPYSIRKAHELTTIDNQVATYAYYFYRLLQRAKDITIVYNSTADERNTGEMSRFMLQLLVESGHKIEKFSLKAGLSNITRDIKGIEKTPAVMKALTDRFDISLHKDRDPRITNDPETPPLLTPSAINRYLRCPLQFFYNYLCGLRENEFEDEDEIDNRIFGNIFHAASQFIYERLTQSNSRITKSDIERLLKNGVEIEQAVDRAFREELFLIKNDRFFCPEYNGLQIINRQVIITYLRRLLEIDMRLAPFDIVGLENVVLDIIGIKCGDRNIETTIGGRIDRLDCINDGNGERLRIVDYKTGGRKLGTMNEIADVFNPDNIGGDKHSDNYLQAMLYSVIVRRKYNPHNLPVSPALLFIQHTMQEGYDPTLLLAKKRIDDIATHADEYMEKLNETLSEIFNPSLPFSPTTDDSRCEHCPYREMCGV
ncbi:MAG: PD-(D/E)XK nuclease family protein [Prevotella sp.]|nr:PD-(D/E)XK nuclease family protein [Prevotella sp.]